MNKIKQSTKSGNRYNARPEGTRTPHNGSKGKYIKIKRDGIWQFEHRVVMEDYLNRKLLRGEIVHHINNDTNDNRIENLELFSSNGAHLSKTNTKGRKCSIDGCDREHKAHGLCTLHYHRLQKFGSTDKPPIRERKPCSVDGCEKLSRMHGFCSMHYERFKKYGDPLYEREIKLCSIEGCNRKHQARGYCAMHYLKLKRKGIIKKLNNH